MPRKTVTELLQLLHDHAAETEDLEDAAAAAVPGTLRRKLLDVTQWVAQQWVHRFGTLDTPADPIGMAGLVGELRNRLAATRVDPTVLLDFYGSQALDLGIQHALSEVGLPETFLEKPLATFSDRLVDRAVKNTQETVSRRYQQADRVLSVVRGTNHGDLMTGIAVANQAVTSIERTARWVVNRESNNGVRKVSTALDADLMWVAERDACLACIAYSGVRAAAGQAFPPDLTYGTKPITPWPDGILELPPLHPNCRCRVTPWLGHDVAGALDASVPGWAEGRESAAVALSDALKREAQRSVLKGWSLESEPNALRIRAADQLLKRGVNLPKSVQETARRAVIRNQFASRSVPKG